MLQVHPSRSWPRTTFSDHTVFKLCPRPNGSDPAVLEASGNIYAAFGNGCCDTSSNLARGWFLGWNASTVVPLGSDLLTDSLAHAPDAHGNNFFASSI